MLTFVILINWLQVGLLAYILYLLIEKDYK